MMTIEEEQRDEVDELEAEGEKRKWNCDKKQMKVLIR